MDRLSMPDRCVLRPQEQQSIYRARFDRFLERSSSKTLELPFSFLPDAGAKHCSHPCIEPEINISAVPTPVERVRDVRRSFSHIPLEPRGLQNPVRQLSEDVSLRFQGKVEQGQNEILGAQTDSVHRDEMLSNIRAGPLPKDSAEQ